MTQEDYDVRIVVFIEVVPEVGPPRSTASSLQPE